MIFSMIVLSASLFFVTVVSVVRAVLSSGSSRGADIRFVRELRKVCGDINDMILPMSAPGTYGCGQLSHWKEGT